MERSHGLMRRVGDSETPTVALDCPIPWCWQREEYPVPVENFRDHLRDHVVVSLRPCMALSDASPTCPFSCCGFRSDTVRELAEHILSCPSHCPSTIREFLIKCFVRTTHSGQLILQHPAQGQAGDSLSYESGSSNLRSVPDNGREGSQEDSIGMNCNQEERKMRRHSGLQTPTIAHFGVNECAEAAGMLDIQRRRYLCS
jgi:hypothetical protein